MGISNLVGERENYVKLNINVGLEALVIVGEYTTFENIKEFVKIADVYAVYNNYDDDDWSNSSKILARPKPGTTTMDFASKLVNMFPTDCIHKVNDGLIELHY